jgi:hypothetical protein
LGKGRGFPARSAAALIIMARLVALRSSVFGVSPSCGIEAERARCASLGVTAAPEKIGSMAASKLFEACS